MLGDRVQNPMGQPSGSHSPEPEQDPRVPRYYPALVAPLESDPGWGGGHVGAS